MTENSSLIDVCYSLNLRKVAVGGGGIVVDAFDVVAVEESVDASLDHGDLWLEVA